jgi:hypothetical protein
MQDGFDLPAPDTDALELAVASRAKLNDCRVLDAPVDVGGPPRLAANPPVRNRVALASGATSAVRVMLMIPPVDVFSVAPGSVGKIPVRR